MQPSTGEPAICRTCGAPLQSDHRFCPACGTFVERDAEASATFPEAGAGSDAKIAQPPATDPDPSVLETSQQPTQRIESQYAPVTGPPEPQPQSTDFGQAHPTWGTPETTVPPESGNRTLWIIIGIVAFIVLVCCCLLPLGLVAISGADAAFQEELRSMALTMRG